MSDFAEPIANAVKKVFPDCRRGKCYYHLTQNLVKRYKKTGYDDLKEYINFLGSCMSSNQLKFSWDLIKKDVLKNKKLKEISKDFVDYFEKEYMKQENMYWYIGALPEGYSNTNNMLEGHNRHLKHNLLEKKVRNIGKF